MTLNTIALELVPPNVERGPEYAVEEARKVARISAESGLEGRIKHVMIPGMIAEDDDRPVPMKPKLDVLDYWSLIQPELPGLRGLCTQVTAFMDEAALGRRLTTLGDAGFEGIVFVGVPRTMNDGDGSGVPPTDALSIYDQTVDNRGVIVIPTREGEQGRFEFKCSQGANSVYAAAVLRRDRRVPHRFRQEHRSSARDPAVLRLRAQGRDQGRADRLADPGPRQRRRRRRAGVRPVTGEPRSVDERQLMVDLYKRVIDGVADLGFPLSIHFEATYGVSGAAFETFAEMLAYWSPDR